MISIQGSDTGNVSRVMNGWRETTADNSSDNTRQGFYHHRMIWPPGGDI